jgi:hypothetical protein
MWQNRQKKEWLEYLGNKITCLYVYSRNSRERETKAFVGNNVKLNNRVIKELKSNVMLDLITNSKNKIWVTWNIIKKETGEAHVPEQVCSFLINGEK